jgi:phosphocarrier protein FPr
MVGIVIVSHSARLAEGVAELAMQMVQGEFPLATAGGIDDPDDPIGTDVMKVHAAIEAVYSEDGVVVLMDLGSALLSAEMALEFLTPEQQENVYLIAAPLVEGTVAAVVQANVGAGIEAVMAEARNALGVKREQLGEEEPAGPPIPTTPKRQGPEESLSLTIENEHGLHARPAARFVETANRFSADITVRKGEGERSANAKSINQVATLGVRQGETVLITARGADAEEALEAIGLLAADNFGEQPASGRPTADGGPPTADGSAAVGGRRSAVAPAVAPPGALAGVAAAPGVAVGPAFQYRPQLPEIETVAIEDPAAEWQELSRAIDDAAEEIAQLQKEAEARLGAGEAAIFGAHLLILRDPDVQEDVRRRIERDRINAAAAWQQTVETTAAGFAALDDPYMAGRAADVRDVGNRVLRRLLGVRLPSLDIERPAILLARDLTPSDTARLDPARVLAVATEQGGATSHSAILARALGIPAVVGAGTQLGEIAGGATVGVDGGAGLVWIEPDEARVTALQEAREAYVAAQQKAQEAAQAPATTADDRAIEVAANIGGPYDAEIALQYGAEGVGLFRTEFLFMDREEAPDEEEQLRAYRMAAGVMGDRPVIIRTLDVGGDKPIPYLDLGDEDNPFLGWRGIRFCLEMPDFFKIQLRAILRSSVDDKGVPTGVRLMLPMVGTLEEVRRAKALLEEARSELREQETPFNPEMEVGIMIEVPSAVLVADQLAGEVDFFSIGTNDLTQYTMAADRGNEKVANLVQALHPAVLRMIRRTVEAADAAGIWVGMCGELAGDAAAAPLLVGLGLDELSMSSPSIPDVKAALREITVPEAEALAEEALTLDSAGAVRQLLAGVGTE